MPPGLTLSIIKYISRVKWSNPGKRVAPPLHLDVVAVEKGAFLSPLTKGDNCTTLLLCAFSHFLQFFILFGLFFQKYILLSATEIHAQLAGAVQYTDCISVEG